MLHVQSEIRMVVRKTSDDSDIKVTDTISLDRTFTSPVSHVIQHNDINF